MSKVVVVLAVLFCAAGALAASAAGVRPNLAELAKAERTQGRSMLEKIEGKRKIAESSKPEDDGDEDCSEWKLGTATGYSTDGTDNGDKPMAPNDLGEYVVPGKFFKARNVVAVDGGDWNKAKYRYMEVVMEDVKGTLEVWDVCQDKDCSKDNKDCCSNNKKTYREDGDDGFLVDIETHAANSIWGLENAQNWLVGPVYYRICGKIDREAAVEEFDMECTGLEGDGNCDERK